MIAVSMRNEHIVSLNVIGRYFGNRILGSEKWINDQFRSIYIDAKRCMAIKSKCCRHLGFSFLALRFGCYSVISERQVAHTMRLIQRLRDRAYRTKSFICQHALASTKSPAPTTDRKLLFKRSRLATRNQFPDFGNQFRHFTWLGDK